MCFYEAYTTVRVVREYLNPKFRVPEFSGIVEPLYFRVSILRT
jgi:predicted xylose isomerase-like sugar epimerase